VRRNAEQIEDVCLFKGKKTRLLCLRTASGESALVECGSVLPAAGRSFCFGSAGPLERVEYLGRTAAGAEIYQVRYRYIAATAYRVAPDPKGKPDQYLVEATDPYWVKKEISSPAAPILIYARPEDAAPCIDHSNFGGQLNPTY